MINNFLIFINEIFLLTKLKSFEDYLRKSPWYYLYIKVKIIETVSPNVNIDR